MSEDKEKIKKKGLKILQKKKPSEEQGSAAATDTKEDLTAVAVTA